jgi:hypothetical protein
MLWDLCLVRLGLVLRLLFLPLGPLQWHSCLALHYAAWMSLGVAQPMPTIRQQGKHAHTLQKKAATDKTVNFAMSQRQRTCRAPAAASVGRSAPHPPEYSCAQHSTAQHSTAEDHRVNSHHNSQTTASKVCTKCKLLQPSSCANCARLSTAYLYPDNVSITS